MVTSPSFRQPGNSIVNSCEGTNLRSLIAVLTLGLLAVLSSTTLLADEGEINVIEAKAESRFPDGIRFSVTAESPGFIDEIRVFFKKVDQSDRSAYRSFEFEPGQSVTEESLLLSSSGNDYFPPGTKIEFSFEVRDKAGGVVRTESEQFVYEDNRFEWLTVNNGLITVYYYGSYVEERARVILEAAEQAMERMLPVLGINPTKPLRIVSYNNYRHMSLALPFRSQAVREGLQTQGMAFADERVLLVHGFDATVTGTTSHEFVHLLVAEAAGGTATAVPAWLNEGLAEYGNIDPTDDYDAALRYGIFTRRVRPLWMQDSFGGTPEDIIIAYGQGRSVVRYMIREYGEPRMAELFRVLQGTPDIDRALLEVYGMDQYGLDSAWRESLGLDPLPSPEELESQLRDSYGNADTESAVEDTALPATEDEKEDTAAEVGVPDEQVQTTPETAVGDTTEVNDPAPVSSGGCNAPVHGGSGAQATSVGMLALLASPTALIAVPALRRRWRFS